MTNPLNMRTRSDDLICDLVLDPITSRGRSPLVVDAGARSGMLELPATYAARARLMGFEPNPVEHEKLVKQDTDPIRAGHQPPRFAEETYFPTALWDDLGEQTLVITNGIGTPTLMGEADRSVTSNVFLETEGESFYDSALKSVRKETVPTQRLDALVGSDETIDFLKIDVEGGELHVLNGASRLLDRRRVLMIRSEFVAFPYYDQHPILSDQLGFLSAHGFRLIDLDSSHTRYTRGSSKIPAAVDRRPLYGGDALYILDPDRLALDPSDLQRMSAISLALGYASLGVGLLRDAGLLPTRQIDEIEEALARVELKYRAVSAWERVPGLVQRATTTARRYAVRRKRRSRGS